MKAKLEFDLDNPDDRVAHLRCIKSSDMVNVLFQLTRNMQKAARWHFETTNGDAMHGVDYVFDAIQDLLEENNIDIDELI